MWPFRKLLVLLVAGVAGLAAGQDTVTFVHEETGIAFDHPTAWQVKKEKKDLIILLPIEGQTEPARLEIYSAIYPAEAEIWEESQRQVNKQLGREVVRQWREEILGVPLLLTKIGYEDKGSPKAVLTGMLYSASPRKLLFRLVAFSDAYDSAEAQLRTALQSLRTVTGALPQPEDPNRAFDPANLDRPIRSKSSKVTRIEAKPTAPAKVVKGEVAIPVTVANRNVTLRMPSGWSGEASADGAVVLKHSDVSGALRVNVNSLLDSEQPQEALLRASSISLKDYSSVAIRSEGESRTNMAEATVRSIWRRGTGPSGELNTCEAYGWLGDYYWLLSYRINGPMSKKERAAVETLIEGMSVEPGA